ncbi:MAG TPA: allantoinase AllB [Longimicrobium sp.]|nr:allantoinase AllB [Longimicrobium sp.]
MSDTPEPLVLRSAHVVTPDGTRDAAVWVRDGVIAAVRPFADVPAGVAVVECGDEWIIPGLVDTHVHVNDPGRADWEGWESATRAAAAGGVTTLVDMPLNSIPAVTDEAALWAKAKAAAGRTFVDAGLWGGVVPGNAGELRAMWEAGVLGFKCFLSPSGVDEFTHVSEADLRRAMPVLRELGAPLLVHAESPRVLDEVAAATLPGADPRSYATWLASRPPAAEVEAVEMLVRLVRELGTHVHVVHVSAAEALEPLHQARQEGLPITVETCPHYLHFAAEDVPDGATEMKCAPPIRSAGNREDLWTALGAGWIDLVATDHSPCPPEMKLRDEGDFVRAWGGIASVQLGLGAVWRDARERGYTPAHLAQWMSAAPARLAGLDRRKGAIAPGRDADLVVLDPDAEYLVEPGMLLHRHKLSPYVGSVLPGVVEQTWLRGEKIYDRGAITGGPRGRVLLRTAL